MMPPAQGVQKEQHRKNIYKIMMLTTKHQPKIKTIAKELSYKVWDVSTIRGKNRQKPLV